MPAGASLPTSTVSSSGADAEQSVGDREDDATRCRGRSRRPRRRSARARRPAGTRPTEVSACSSATVISAKRVAAAASAIATTSSSNRRPGRAPRPRPGPAPAIGWARRRPGCPRHAPLGSRVRHPGDAAAFGSSTTSGAPVRAHGASTSSTVGRRPSTTRTPSASNRCASPSPGATATIAEPGCRRTARPARRLRSVSRMRVVAELHDGDPVQPSELDACLDRSADVVDVDVHVPRAPRAPPRPIASLVLTTATESPMRPSPARSRSPASAAASSRYCTS